MGEGGERDREKERLLFTFYLDKTKEMSSQSSYYKRYEKNATNTKFIKRNLLLSFFLKFNSYYKNFKCIKINY